MLKVGILHQNLVGKAMIEHFPINLGHRDSPIHGKSRSLRNMVEQVHNAMNLQGGENHFCHL